MPHVSAGGSGSSGSGGSGASSSAADRIRSDDPNDCDEVKVFKCAEDEGEGESDDVINDDKRDLIRLTECDQKGGRISPGYPSGGHSSGYSSSGIGKNGHSIRPDPASIFSKSLEGVAHPSPLNMGYLVPYPYANGSPLSTMVGKMGLGAGSLPFFCNVNGADGLTQPPPAHMGIPPYNHFDPTKAVHGLSRSPMYPFGVQYPYPGLPEVSQVASWYATKHAQSMYSISNAGNPAASAGFRNYPPSLSIPPTSIASDFYRFSPGGLLQGPGLPPHPGLGHHLVGTPSKHDAHHSHLDHNHRSSSLSDPKSSDTHGSKNASESGQSNNSQNEKKKPHIKKPLNAFMLYMKEMRAKVVAECTLKESAAINQILGRRWHSLSREEQAKYYEKARQERQLHMQMYPGWSARDNYGYGAKKKKRKKEKTSDGGREEQAKYYELARRERQLHMQMYPNWSSAQSRTHHEKKRKKKQEKFDGGNSMKKCRARYGLDQQGQWCKPCRRKKKCIRYLEADGGDNGGVASPDDNLGSAGSAGEACTPDSKTGVDSDMDCKSSDMGMSSPNFSLTSPGMSLASPGMSLTSPGMSLPSPALTSPSGILPSPASLASPAVSLPSLQSPMTPSLSDDRHPISSVSSSASSVNFTTTTASNNTNHNSSSTSNNTNSNMNHHNSSSSTSSSPPTNHLLGLHSSSSSSSSSKLSNHHSHHLNNHHHHLSNHHPSSHLGFGLQHLFGSGSSSSSSGSSSSTLNGASSSLSLPTLPLPFPLPMSLKGPPRNPVGANPHDINNPLSVNQLTGQCNSSSTSSSSSSSSLSSRSSSASSHHSHNNNNNSNSQKHNSHSHSRSRDNRGDHHHHHHHHNSSSSHHHSSSSSGGGNGGSNSSGLNKASENGNSTSAPPVIGVS